MAWDFSVEAGKQEVISRKLRELWRDWDLPVDDASALKTMLDEEGLSARFIDTLSTALYAHRGVYAHEIIEALGFVQVFERRSKSANFGMNQLFHSWAETREAVGLFESCAVLQRPEILGLLEWLEICAALIKGDNLAYYDRESAVFLQAAECCAGAAEDADMRSFAFDWERYRQLKWDIENRDSDLFYWYNSY